MTDTKDDKTLTVAPKKTLTLKRPGIEQGTVRQNFSHGRTKSVVVETKKRKFSAPGEQREAAPVITPAAPKPAVTVAPPPNVERTPRPAPTVRPASDRGGVVLNSLSRGEMDARRRALEEAKIREVEDRARAIEDAKRRAEEDERRQRERQESARRQAEEEARIQAEAEARRRAEEEARRRSPQADVADEEEEQPIAKLRGEAVQIPAARVEAHRGVKPRELHPIAVAEHDGVKLPLLDGAVFHREAANLLPG